MKKHNKSLIIFLFAIALIIILTAMIYRYAPRSQDPQDICLENNLTWLENYGECEFMSQETCELHSGIYTECGSACRHNPEAVYCIQMCVPYCKFA